MQVMRMTRSIRMALYSTMKAWKEAIRKQSKSSQKAVKKCRRHCAPALFTVDCPMFLIPTNTSRQGITENNRKA